MSKPEQISLDEAGKRARASAIFKFSEGVTIVRIPDDTEVTLRKFADTTKYQFIALVEGEPRTLSVSARMFRDIYALKAAGNEFIQVIRVGEGMATRYKIQGVKVKK